MAANLDAISVAAEAPGAAASLWNAVDALIDRAPSVAALREHGLHLLAGRRWRSLGRPVADELLFEERAAAAAQLAVRPLLERVRQVVDGPLLVFKGPEVAALYPQPGLRPFVDIDLLVRDAGAAQRALLAAGFEEVGDPSLYLDIHHLRPLRWDGLPLQVEVHTHPKWLDGVAPPEFEALAEAAGPSSCEIEGVQTLARRHHAVVLAVHSWAHQPLRKVSELVDVAAMSNGIRPPEIEAVAREWGVERLWRTVTRSGDAIFFGGRPSWHLRTWARSVIASRQRTVLETHLESILSPLGAARPLPALTVAARAALGDMRPGASESWGRKVRRTTIAIGNAFQPRSDHDRDLAERELL